MLWSYERFCQYNASEYFLGWPNWDSDCIFFISTFRRCYICWRCFISYDVVVIIQLIGSVLLKPFDSTQKLWPVTNELWSCCVVCALETPRYLCKASFLSHSFLFHFIPPIPAQSLSRFFVGVCFLGVWYVCGCTQSWPGSRLSWPVLPF